MEGNLEEAQPIVKEVFEAHNRARTDPKGFAKVLEDIMQHFEKDGKLLKVPGQTPVMHHEGLSAYKEAVKFLKKQKPVEPELFYNELLEQAAGDHAEDIGSRGLTGHTGSDKSTYNQRIERYCKWGGAIYESIDYSKPEIPGEQVVAKLIVDDGVKARSHRNCIFNSAYKHVGISAAEHTKMGRVIVIDYGAQIISHKAYLQMQAPPKEETKSTLDVDPNNIDWIDLAKKVGEEINKVRKNPRYLSKQLERSLERFQGFKTLKVKGREVREMQEGAPAYIEAIEWCETTKPVKPLKNSLNLKKSAQDHVNDIGQNGITTQKGSDGCTPKDRIEKYTSIDDVWSESICFGGYKPKEIVEYMLVSDGMRTRGLRKNIFNSNLKIMGVAVGPHSKEGSVTVIDFASKELAAGQAPTMNIEYSDEVPQEALDKVEELGLQGKVKMVKGNPKKNALVRLGTAQYSAKPIRKTVVSFFTV